MRAASSLSSSGQPVRNWQIVSSFRRLMSPTVARELSRLAFDAQDCWIGTPALFALSRGSQVSRQRFSDPIRRLGTRKRSASLKRRPAFYAAKIFTKITYAFFAECELTLASTWLQV